MVGLVLTQILENLGVCFAHHVLLLEFVITAILVGLSLETYFVAKYKIYLEYDCIKIRMLQ